MLRIDGLTLLRRWREAHPGNELVLPDRANLVVWLLELIQRSAPPSGSCEGGGPAGSGLPSQSAIRRSTATSITSSEAPTCAQTGIGIARRLSMTPAETRSSRLTAPPIFSWIRIAIQRTCGS